MQEVHKLTNLKHLSQRKIGAQYLSLDVEELAGDARIKGRYTLKTKMEERDFEKEITDPKVNNEERLSYVGNYLS